jgi:hypothetical protein
MVERHGLQTALSTRHQLDPGREVYEGGHRFIAFALQFVGQVRLKILNLEAQARSQFARVLLDGPALKMEI